MSKFYTLTNAFLAGFTLDAPKHSSVKVDADEVSDGYHTMSELYDHRRALTVALLNIINNKTQFGHSGYWAFKSKLHSDGTMFDGYFIVGLYRLEDGSNERFSYISYHYALEYWDQFNIPELERAPKYDGHTSQDIIERLLKL